jgi:hypothetical protein
VFTHPDFQDLNLKRNAEEISKNLQEKFLGKLA